MGTYVAEAAVKKMIEAGQAPQKSHVVILGLTFKENCPDIRNSKVNDIIKCLNSYGIMPEIVDPWVIAADAKREYGLKLTELSKIRDVDCIIVAVAHNEFKSLNLNEIKELFKVSADKEKVLIDVKGLYKIKDLEKSGLRYWRL